MADDFETEVEHLFSQAPRLADDEAFVASVRSRTERLRRIGRIVYGSAVAVGGAISIAALSQVSLWSGLAAWLGRVDPPLADPSSIDPWIWVGVAGAALVAAYVGNLLRER